MLSMTIVTWIKGKLVGQDSLGNKYYSERFLLTKPSNQRPRRWVRYQGIKEASKIPAEWHGWLHFTTDQLPTEGMRPTYAWQKAHLPNATGTKHAYSPSTSPPTQTLFWTSENSKG